MSDEGYQLVYPDVVAKASPQAAEIRRDEYVVANADIILCCTDSQIQTLNKIIRQMLPNTKTPVNIIKQLKEPPIMR